MGGVAENSRCAPAYEDGKDYGHSPQCGSAPFHLVALRAVLPDVLSVVELVY